MPQLDFSVFPSQLFWLTISFFSMLFIMKYFIIPKTAEMINLRKEKINGNLEKAAEIERQVEATVERYNQTLQEARNKANLSLQKTKDELAETINRKQADLADRLRAEIEAGEKKIAASRASALEKMEKAATELAIDVLDKLGFDKVKPQQAADALNALKKE